MTPELRSRLAVLATFAAAAGGAFILAQPAWPGPPVELCVASDPGGVALRAKVAANGYLYVATESDSGARALVRVPTTSTPAETPMDLAVVPAQGVVRMMFTKAPLDAPESAIFRDPDPAIRVALGPTGVSWDGEATPAGCLVVPFAKRPFGYRYTIRLGEGA